MKLGFLASHGGSAARAVVQACASGRLMATPTVLISNNSGSAALAWAKAEGLRTAHLSSARIPDPAELDAVITRTLEQAGAEWVILSGYMREVGPALLAAYPERVLNIHPSLLPKHGGRGMYGDRVHAAVLAAGETESGASVHLVTAGIDEGPVVAQSRVQVYPNDTLETLRSRVQATEGELMVQALAGLVQSR